MTLRTIRFYGDPVLHTATDEVKVFDTALHTLVGDMFETMDAAGGVGLAANQVGVSKRVFVYSCQGMRGHLVNPSWRPVGNATQIGPEGCLSVPGVRANIARHTAVIATGEDAFGRPMAISASGLLARCIQHESDHLDGGFFLRNMDPDDRRRAMEHIRDAQWFSERPEEGAPCG